MGDKEMGSSQGLGEHLVLSPKSDNAGAWIKVTDARQPVADGEMVDVKFAHGGVCLKTEADGWDWGEQGSHSITFYRLSDGGEAVHEQVSQPIRDEPKSPPTKAPSREEVALMIASWPAHYRDLGPDNEVIGDRVSMDPSQDIGEIPGSIERLADAIITLFKGGEQ